MQSPRCITSGNNGGGGQRLCGGARSISTIGLSGLDGDGHGISDDQEVGSSIWTTTPLIDIEQDDLCFVDGWIGQGMRRSVRLPKGG